MNNHDLIQMYAAARKTVDLISEQIIRADIDWRHLVEYGLTVEAIKAYRKLHQCELRVAHEAITAYRRS